MTTTDYIVQIITLFGGLALFLFGMDYMGKSLERTAGGKLQNILATMSSTMPRGFLLGLAVTAVIQSSSATTVMVVGFVNSGIMTLSQSVGVIMGANVGTAVTAWIISLNSVQGESLIMQLLNPDCLAPILGVIGIVLFMFCKSEKKKSVGSILLGFLALMVGMDMMSGSMSFLKSEAWFAELMIAFSNPIIGVLVGTLLTALIQSSSASVGILQSLSLTGAVQYSTAVPVILGQNIGTCVTALISSFGTNKNARRTAWVHLYFNIIGAVLFMIVFYLIDAFAPWEFLNWTANPVGIAIVHTVFKLITTAIFMPFNKVLVKLAELTVKNIPGDEDEHIELLDERLIAIPAVAVRRAKDIAVKMGEIANQCYTMATELTHNYDEAKFKEIKKLEDKTDKYEDALGSYLLKLTDANLAREDNLLLNTLLYTIGDLERIADHAAAIAVAAKEIEEKPVKFSEQAKTELAVLEIAVGDLLERTITAYRDDDLFVAKKVEPHEQVVDVLVRECKSRHIARLRDGKCTVEYGFVLDDMLTAYERISDHCSSIAAEMIQAAEGKMDIHEYLELLKSGELNDSRYFEEKYDEYLSRYDFPKENA